MWAGAPYCPQPAQWPPDRLPPWYLPLLPEATEMALGPTTLTLDSGSIGRHLWSTFYVPRAFLGNAQI